MSKPLFFFQKPDRLLAISYEKMGGIYQTLGQLDKALEYYEKDTRISEELFDANPENINLLSGLGISYYRLGLLEVKMSNNGFFSHLSLAAEIFDSIYKATQVERYKNMRDGVLETLESLK